MTESGVPAFTGAVHAVAAKFPMMTNDELDDLAADIKANGLQAPIALDPEGTLIDGRNRVEACRRAGVEPACIVVPAAKVRAYILSANLARRHSTWGQRALLAVLTEAAETVEAEAMDEPDKRTGGVPNWNGSGIREMARVTGIPASRLSEARMIIEHAPALVDEVLDGATTFDAAYKAARDAKAEAARKELDMVRLWAKAADLAAAVAEERMPLDVALAQLERREADHAARVRQNSAALAGAVSFAAAILGVAASRRTLIELFDNAQSGVPFAVSRATLQAAGRNLLQLAEDWPDVDSEAGG